MSSSHSAITMAYSATTEEVDLGLPELPPSLDLQSLFPSERLLRLHPNWFVSDIQQKEKDASFTAAIKDYVTEEESQLSGRFVFNGTEDELLLMQLSGTMDADISFLNRNNRLTVRIASNTPEIDPEDPLLLWIRAIKEYIRIYLKRTPVTLFFRVFMNKMILKMDPSQRKICLMMAKITAVELLVILLVVIGYSVFG